MMYNTYRLHSFPDIHENLKLLTLIIHGSAAPVYMKQKIYPALYIPIYGSNTACGG